MATSTRTHLQLAPGASVQLTVQHGSILSHRVSLLVPQSHCSPGCTTPLPHSDSVGPYQIIYNQITHNFVSYIPVIIIIVDFLANVRHTQCNIITCNIAGIGSTCYVGFLFRKHVVRTILNMPPALGNQERPIKIKITLS